MARRRGGPVMGPAALCIVALLAAVAAPGVLADQAAQRSALQSIASYWTGTNPWSTASTADPCDASAFPGVSCNGEGSVSSM